MNASLWFYYKNLSLLCFYVIRVTTCHAYRCSYFWTLATVICLLQKLEYKASGPGSIPVLRQNSNAGI